MCWDLLTLLFDVSWIHHHYHPKRNHSLPTFQLNFSIHFPCQFVSSSNRHLQKKYSILKIIKFFKLFFSFPHKCLYKKTSWKESSVLKIKKEKYTAFNSALNNASIIIVQKWSINKSIKSWHCKEVFILHISYYIPIRQ